MHKIPTLTQNRRLQALLTRVPYWILVLCLLVLLAIWNVVNDEKYRHIFFIIGKGIGITLFVTAISFLCATIIGLCVGLMRISQHKLIREISTLYTELLRGIPMLVILYYITFVAAPQLVIIINWLTTPLRFLRLVDFFTIRDIPFLARAAIALSLGYSAFIAEIFRAGILSLDRGQKEAALALGMNRFTTLTSIIIPQAIRNILPALGNELVAMLKDSALVSALGVQDITHIGKTYAASSFRFFETYNAVALLYLVLTISLTLIVRKIESYLSKHKYHS